MTIFYHTLRFNSPDNEKVSGPWYVLLWDLHFHDPVSYIVTEGHRTMARQRELVKEKGLWSPSNPTGAAAPSRFAPHIRTGMSNHAIDFENAAGVAAAARKRGVIIHRPIVAEPWHGDPDHQTLLNYYHKNRRRVWRERRKLRRKGVKI
jgi:hypothetical protein